MAIVGLNFDKLIVERKDNISGKVTINNNISIKDIEERDLSLGKTKQNGLRFKFEFTSKYNPDLAEIKINGDVMYLEDAVKVKKILDEWKKDKKIDKEILTPVLNSALTKCNIQALILSKEVNLPPPLNLPKLKPREKENYIG